MNLFGNAHARYEVLVTEHLDGVLDAAGEAELSKHLATCAECSTEVREQEALLSVLHAEPMVEVPRSFALPYAPRAAAAESRMSKLVRAMQIATATAALVLVALVGFNIAYGPSSLPTGSGSNVENTTTLSTDASAQATPAQGIHSLAPSSSTDTSQKGFSAMTAPDNGETAGLPATQDQSIGRSGLEWALIAMSGFTGVLALAVVAATWIPKRPF